MFFARYILGHDPIYRVIKTRSAGNGRKGHLGESYSYHKFCRRLF